MKNKIRNGDYFKVNGEKYRLCMIRLNEIVAIEEVSANRWRGSVVVKDSNDISQDELDEIFHGCKVCNVKIEPLEPQI